MGRDCEKANREGTELIRCFGVILALWLFFVCVCVCVEGRVSQIGIIVEVGGNFVMAMRVQLTVVLFCLTQCYLQPDAYSCFASGTVHNLSYRTFVGRLY